MASQAMFTLNYRGVPVTLTPTDPATLPATFTALAAAIDAALAAGWTGGGNGEGDTPEDGKARKTAVIHGYVYGKSAKSGIPLVWLYSNNHPYLVRKVTQVYDERIKELPITIPPGLRPIKGGVAPEKKAAIEDGDYNECAPFTIELVDTGEVYLEHPVFEFARVIPSTKPAPVTTQPQPPAPVVAPPPTQSAPQPVGNGAGPVLSEKAQVLIDYNKIGLELFSNNWPKASRDKASHISRGATTDVNELPLEQLQEMLGNLKDLQAKRTNGPRVTPPPTGK